jgi:hypothetical protein
MSAQNIGVPREPSTREDRGSQTPSSTRRILLNIAKAVVEVLCAEYGNCTSPSGAPTETTAPSSGEEGRYLTPDFAGDNLRSAPRQRGFSFAPPTGWQTYEEQSSVTVARPSEYVNADLANGVILGLFDLNGASFETGAESYVRDLISNNKYLKRVGWPESNVVNNVPCITTRMEGQSPKTHHIEKVVVYACKRSTRKLFYVVTVNSGPHSNWYDEQNLRITQSISFQQ